MFSDDWNIETTIENDVIAELTIKPKSDWAKKNGINTTTLRGISINSLLRLADEPNPIETNYDTNLLWRMSVIGKWPSPGINPHPDYLYARVAYFYYIARRVNINRPIKELALMLNIDVRLAGRRVLKARKLGLLTNINKPNPNVPAGKSGGRLTNKCIKLLEETRKQFDFND
jgi:hypothetical protein